MKNQANHTNQKNQGSDNLKPFYNTTIPSDWEVMEFGNFAEPQKAKYVPIENEDLPCLELEHFDQGTGSINGWVNSSEQKSTKNKFQKGQVLFGKLRPYLQKYWLAEFDGVCSSEVWVLNSKDKKCSNEFLFRLIQSNKFIQVANVSSGSKMPRADWDYVSEFPFALPPLPEQRAIAHVLSLMDTAINKNMQLIAQKELRKKWLMQNLLTGRKRLKGFSGEWKDYTINKLFEKAYRYVEWDEKESYDLVSIRRRYGGLFFRGDLLGENIEVKKLKSIRTGDFLISKRQVSHGAWVIVTSEYDGGKVSDEYDSLEITNAELLNADFWGWYCQQKLMTHYAYLDSIGVHIEKLIFHYSLFKKREVKIPKSIAEQTAIAAVLQAADKEIQLLKTKTEKLREQKKGMMQVLLTGKKRLKYE